MPSSQEITELIDDINSKITYLQAVREDATIEIHRLIDTKHELIDTYRNTEV